MSFQDHFSSLAKEYARTRPGYPPELFSTLASLTPQRSLAWDCGTGNGQAAVALADHFDRVIATDGSTQQIAHAFPHPKIEYRVEPATGVSLSASSVDLVTVATAVHWFPLDKFYDEVRRVTRPDGVVAVWTYQLPVVEPGIDPIIARYCFEVVGPYWPDEIRFVNEHYRTLPFPFEEVTLPQFHHQAVWNLNALLGFLGSWSASERFRTANGADPLNVILPELSKAWGQSSMSRTIRWPLHLRVGRVHP